MAPWHPLFALALLVGEGLGRERATPYDNQ